MRCTHLGILPCQNEAVFVFHDVTTALMPVTWCHGHFTKYVIRSSSYGLAALAYIKRHWRRLDGKPLELGA
jgi:hypothetical protein